MKLYDSRQAPNPRRARIFLAEKGITLPTEQVDMMTMQHKTPEYTAINPLQRMPALVLDDGTVITELIAICRYFEVLQPEPPLFGVRRQRDRAGGDVEPALRDQFLLECRGRVPPPASGDEGAGGAAGAGLGRGHEAARDLVSGIARQRIGQARIHRRRPLFGRRHHHLVAVDFMKPAKLAMPEGARQRETLARRGVGAAQCESIIAVSGPAARSGSTCPSACRPSSALRE